MCPNSDFYFNLDLSNWVHHTIVTEIFVKLTGPAYFYCVCILQIVRLILPGCYSKVIPAEGRLSECSNACGFPHVSESRH